MIRLCCGRGQRGSYGLCQRRALASDRGLAIESLEPRLALDALSLADFYTSGRGFSLAFQQLQGFAVATNYQTIIDGNGQLPAGALRRLEHAGLKA